MKYIIGGGGTGGHIFPAIAIANALTKLDNSAEILFVGAENRMEMDRVPKEGYKIKGLPVAGFNRKNIIKNIPVVFKLMKSMGMARKIVKEFSPDIVIGVGGYASGPVLKVAQRRKIPTLIQEQNSYAGVTNKMLAKNADSICVAYDGMDRFFPQEKIIKTGNPLRQNIKQAKKIDKKEAKRILGFDQEKKLIVAVGGSLGARTINEGIKNSLHDIINENVALLWQTGKFYFNGYSSEIEKLENPNIRIVPFIEEMDVVYAAADLIISRAGAATISEIQFLGLPSILIPSPNVAEDHQRKNAEALFKNGASEMILDKDAIELLPAKIKEIVNDSEKLKKLGENASLMGLGDADNEIAKKIIEIIKNHR